MYGFCCFGRKDVMAGKTVVGVPLGRLYYPLTTFCPLISSVDEKKATEGIDPIEDAVAKMKKWDARFEHPTEPILCAASEGDLCQCNGAVVFGKKYVTNKSPGSGAVATLEQTRKVSSIQKSIYPELRAIRCTSEAMGVDPLPGYHKHCFCVPINVATARENAKVDAVFSNSKA